MSTTARLLTLLSLLQSRRDWPGETLSLRLEVSPRTVRRDVDRLRDMGYRVVATRGPEGGYRLDRGSELPPLLFDDEQAVALALALATATQSGVAVGDAAARALATVRQVLPSALRNRVDVLAVESLPDPGRVGAPVDPAVLEAVAVAIRESRTLRFDYASAVEASNSEATSAPRIAQPHHVVSTGGRWYVIAWDPDAGDWRLFRADRLALKTHPGARFTRRPLPGGDPLAFVAARFRGALADSDGAWPCVGSAVLQLPVAAVAPYLHDGSAEPIADAATRVVAGSWSWAGLAASLARFDADLTEVTPRELREAFQRLSSRAEAAGHVD